MSAFALTAITMFLIVVYVLLGLLFNRVFASLHTYYTGSRHFHDDVWYWMSAMMWPILWPGLAIFTLVVIIVCLIIDQLPKVIVLRYGSDIQNFNNKDITVSLSNYLRATYSEQQWKSWKGHKVDEESLINFLEIDGWRKIKDESRMWTRIVSRKNLVEFHYEGED